MFGNPAVVPESDEGTIFFMILLCEVAAEEGDRAGTGARSRCSFGEYRGSSCLTIPAVDQPRRLILLSHIDRTAMMHREGWRPSELGRRSAFSWMLRLFPH